MNDSKMKIIQGLLDKATSTSFQEEADAFFAKAAELMGKYSIDEAALRSAGSLKDTKVVRWTVRTGQEYKTERQRMRGNILMGLGAKVILTGSDENGKILKMECFATESVKEMAMNIMVQAEIHMMRTVYNTDSVGHARSFRRSFIVEYGQALRKILEDSLKAGEDEALKNVSESTALVLVDDKKKVQQEYRQAFPNAGKARSLSTQSTGRSAARQAASSFTGHMKQI